MTKYSLLLLPLLVATTCYGASISSKAALLPNSATLDADSQMLLRWGFIEGTGDIEMELQANCTGWLGIGLTLFGDEISDLIQGGFDDVTGLGYLEDRYVNTSDPINGGTPDDSIDWILKGAVYHEPWTVIRVARSIFTGDVYDHAVVPGPMIVAWAYSASDDYSLGHDTDKRGVALVTLIQ